MLESEESDWGSQTVARRTRKQEQLLTHLAWEMRGGAFSHERRNAHRVATQQCFLDLVEVSEEAAEGVDASAIPGGGFSHGR
jgi:hypothetical protein